MRGAMAFFDSAIFAVTPLVGWAVAGAFGFITGQIVVGIVFLCLLIIAGVFFFWTVYRSNPDFYDETLGVPSGADKTEDVRQDVLQINHVLKGDGASVFYYKHSW